MFLFDVGGILHQKTELLDKSACGEYEFGNARDEAEGILQAMNILRYDVANLAPRDATYFSNMPDLRKMAEFTPTPEYESVPGSVEKTILERDGVSLGVLGFAADLDKTALPSDTLDALNDAVKELDEQADIVVMLAYGSTELGKQLFKKVGADVIVSNTTTEHPNLYGLGRALLYGPQNDRQLARIVLQLDDDKAIEDYEMSVLELEESVPHDKSILPITDRLLEQRAKRRLEKQKKDNGMFINLTPEEFIQSNDTETQ